VGEWAVEGEAWSRSGAGLGNGEGRVGNGYKLDIMYQPMDHRGYITM
jgi:hypothetical protein